MFKVGDAVVYPPYGAGYVTAIVEQENIQQMQEKYYMIELLLTNMNILVPSNSVEKIRFANTLNEIKAALSNLIESNQLHLLPINHRIKKYEQILIKGEVQIVAEIWRILSTKRRDRGLNQVERDIYNKFHDVIISEIMIAENCTRQCAEDVLENCF